MDVFRIARTRFVNDLSGAGARAHGGRWNSKGVAVVYTSESRALATAECLVHVPMSLAPRDLSIATVRIPADAGSRTILARDLPRDWRTYPAPESLAVFGGNWVAANEHLMLRVPSAVVEDEYNVLLNPAHPDMARVQITRVQPFALDPRLLRGG